MGTSTNPVETVAIVDLGNDIQLTYSVSGIVYTLNKLSLRLKQTSKAVYITNADGFNNSPDNQVIPLKYYEVTAPSGLTSNDELFAALLGMASGVSLGGSAGASGDGVYSSGSGSLVATPTAGTANVTITGYPYTFDGTQVLSATKHSSAGVKESLNTGQVTVAGGVITFVGEDDFAAGDTVKVYLEGPYRSYDDALDSDIVTVLNPEYAHWTSVEHLIDVSAVGNAVTSRYVIPMESYKNLSMHIKLATTNAADTITLTLWATNNPDADDTADTDWVDVSATVLGAASKAANNTTLEEMYFVDTNMIPLKYMVKTVTASGGTDTNAADVYIKKA